MMIHTHNEKPKDNGIEIDKMKKQTKERKKLFRFILLSLRLKFKIFSLTAFFSVVSDLYVNELIDVLSLVNLCCFSVIELFSDLINDTDDKNRTEMKTIGEEK